ncbi:hypothetical protein LTR53_004920 [Teratosphaeriaceae sp. CCFEE 6253]|nr:hypothetical protein LTR53_004920 [Teratosphaeriaceae sp. CCFEE 6253]
MASHDEEIDVDDAPTSINPYTVLAIPTAATHDQIKSAYRKAALKHHPDKAPPAEKDNAHAKFQEIAFAYAILSDERRRKRYDSTGHTAESLDLEDDDFDWTAFFREQFRAAVTEASITQFADEYRYGDEERRHVLAAYTQCAGSMEGVYARVMVSDMLVDEERFRGMIDAAIEAGEVEGYKRYTGESEAARTKRMERERKRRDKQAREAEKEKAKMEEEGAGDGVPEAKSGMGDLAALIQKRQAGRSAGDFIAGLEAKYAGQQGKKGAKRVSDEPPEEAFAKNRAGAVKTAERDAGAGVRRSKRAKKE